MFRARSIQSSLSIKDKIISIDYILVISIFILGLTSILAMYSTDGGEFKYHTKSHILRFFVFFWYVFDIIIYSNKILAQPKLFNLYFVLCIIVRS